MPSLRWVIRMGVVWCALGRIASAQLPGLAVDPHFVFLTEHQPAGRITVFNPKATAVRYDIHLRYGSITTDSTGRPQVRLAGLAQDSAPTSAARWVTPYPKTFVLNPGASQTIRLLAKPPHTLSTGEYWARLIIQSRELVPPLPPRSANDSGMRIGVSIETSTVLPLFYRAGTVTTGITIDSLSARREGNTIVVQTTLHRLGNAAYIGTATLTLSDTLGAPALTVVKRVAVYDSLTPQWIMPLPPHTPSQRYHLTLLVSTDRPDIPRNTIIRAPAAGRSLDVQEP